jgi:mRNA-degrading endonuclease RelE of RelBE toxin-antitoxin system
MQINLTESFQKDCLSLQENQRNRIFDILLKIPNALKNPHSHSGMGLRKLHPSGIYEARLGLDLRLLFGFREGKIFLHRVANHEDIRRYLKSL